MTRRPPLLALLLVAVVPHLSHAAEALSLARSWRIHPGRSTELSPWRGYELTIQLDGDRVAIERRLGAGQRQFTDAMTINTTNTGKVVTLFFQEPSAPIDLNL